MTFEPVAILLSFSLLQLGILLAHFLMRSQNTNSNRNWTKEEISVHRVIYKEKKFVFHIPAGWDVQDQKATSGEGFPLASKHGGSHQIVTVV